MSRRRPITLGAGLGSLALAAIALGACGGGGDETTTSASSYQLPSLSLGGLHRCTSGQPGPRSMRCGAIKVPFERQDPSLGKTRIGFAVRPRGEQGKPSRGTIFAVEGGPGYGSSWTTRSYIRLFRGLLDRRDLVMVDMRGTGKSVPLVCRDLQYGRGPDWIALPKCAHRLGPRFASYRTSAAADDINDVRRSLGLGRITLYGDSYGTYLGQSYAFRHPDTLNALVLDAAYPARGESAWYPSLISTGVRSMSIACDESPKCSGDAGARLSRLVDLLRTKHRGVGPLVDALAVAGNSAPDSYLKIDRAGRALLAGRPAPYRLLVSTARLGGGHVRHYSATDEEVVSCNDYPLLWDKDASESERRRQLEQAVRSYRSKAGALKPFTPRDVGLSSDTLYQYCLTAPRPSPLYEHPISPGEKPTKAPVLVVSGQLDDVTSPHEGTLVAAEFPDARHYVAPGAGHVADLYDGHSPPAVHTRRFLRHVLNGSG
jgi:pimeloyl-ACP methyl ester carboxylesterase